VNSKKDNTTKKDKLSDIDFILNTMKKPASRKDRKVSGTNSLFEPLCYREKLGWAEMRGGRPDMQDTISIYTNFRNSSARTLLCSFDGHSGELSAEYAANSIGHIIASNLKEKEKSLRKKNKQLREELKEEDFIQVFTKSFRDIHFSIREQKIDDGTAALVVLVEEDRKRLIVANAGDQRAVVAKGDIAVPITTDHKPDEPGERFRVYSEGGFVNEQKRVNGILSLSRSLGDTDLQPYVTYVPDVFFVDLSSGEYRFLIIACDGLWDVVSNQKAVELVDKYSMDPVRSAAALRDYAHLLGSSDNISVIVYKLDFDRRESNIIVPPSSSSTESSSSEVIEQEKDNIHISPELPGPEPTLVNLTSNPNV
jgi:adenylate cyclase